MVSETVQRYGKRISGDRVPIFQIALAAADLSDMAPRRNDVLARDERIVHPFANFVAESVNILNRNTEDSGIAIGRHRVGLRTGVVRAVIAQDAAAARGQERVVVEEQR